MNYCKNCYAPLPSEGAFCPVCGSKTPPKYASFLKRVAAFLIDSALLSFVFGGVSVLLFASSGFWDALLRMAQSGQFDYYEYLRAYIGPLSMSSLLSFAASFVYYTLMDSSSEQGTLGKMALKIKVTDINGNKLTYGRAVGRYFARYITKIANNAFYIGYLMYFFTDKKQVLHDVIASTMVLDK